MRILIVGVGGIGREVAERLMKDRNELVLVDQDRQRCTDLSEQIDALVLHGDGTDPEMLEKAGVRQADALVATTQSDALNLVIALLGRQFGVPKIVVRSDDAGLHPACHQLGVTEIIAPNLAAASRIVSVLHGLHSFDPSLLAHSGLELVQLPAGAASGRKLAELDLPQDALVVAVKRGNEVNLPRRDIELETADILLILVKGAVAAAKVRRAF